VWQLDFGKEMVFARGLPSGNTLLATSHRSWERRPDGTDTNERVIVVPYLDGQGVQRLYNGRLAYVRTDGSSVVVDGRDVRFPPLPPNESTGLRGRSFHILPDGNVLFVNPVYSNQGFRDVSEVDDSGKLVWQCKFWCAQAALERRRNGNAIVLASAGQARRIVEIDHSAKAVWETQVVGDLVRARSCLGLVALGFGEPRPTELDLDKPGIRVHALRDKEPVVRSVAAGVLESVLMRAKNERLADAIKELSPNLPILIAALGDPDYYTQRSVADTLAVMGAAAMPALIKSVENKDERVAIAAMNAVRQSLQWHPKNAKQFAKDGVPVLIEVFRIGQPRLRHEAASAIGEFGAEAKAAVPCLIDALKDKDEIVRISAAHTLGSIGPDARPALLPLFQMLKTKDPSDFYWAAHALARIAGKDELVIRTLVDALNDKQLIAFSRGAAAAALGVIGQPAKAAIPDLVKALRADEQFDARAGPRLAICSARALRGMGLDAESALPELSALLRDESVNYNLREAICETLADLAPAIPSALFRLTEALNAKEQSVQLAALRALERLGPAASSAVPAITKLLSDKDPLVRWTAETALKKIRPDK
jgi:HEAT repeat protein